MRYQAELGIMGNIALLFADRNEIKSEMFGNRAKADAEYSALSEEDINLYEIVADQEYRICCAEMGIDPKDFEEAEEV